MTVGKTSSLHCKSSISGLEVSVARSVAVTYLSGGRGITHLPSRRTGSDPRPVHSRIFASGSRCGRCRLSAGFLGDLPFPHPYIPALLHNHLISPGRGKREIPEKTRRPTASFGTIPTCENPVIRPGLNPVCPGGRRARGGVTPASLAAVGIHGIPRRGSDSYERIVPGRGKDEVGFRLRRGAAESAPAAALRNNAPSALPPGRHAPHTRMRSHPLDVPVCRNGKARPASCFLIGTGYGNITSLLAVRSYGEPIPDTISTSIGWLRVTNSRMSWPPLSKVATPPYVPVSGVGMVVP
ncbi:hypothetical protein PR048_019814 [Dryococelus australis]|uniref:Uncharacterized protein n=1 Tax=Dryococelus australis TaxID=614101 RepID=A0ABQ9H4K0_9NEOP|nr:hypothetical protein PR048_019814 [Dryococelus australis]